jgi:L-ascorbate metabolism protein UlaG (beta-lactamase superfamily)
VRLIRSSLPAAIAVALLGACHHAPDLPGPVPRSDHFDGHHFFNPDGDQGTGGEQKKSGWRMLHDLFFPPDHSWPKVHVVPTVPDRQVQGQKMRVTWIGHATVLIQTQGLNILTDPVWDKRSSPTQLAGVRRVRAPGVRFDDLPHIDLVLVSHDHYDHFDEHILRHIAQRDHPLIVAGLGMDRLMAYYGIDNVAARDWGQSVEVRPGIRVILDRAHHWSAHRFDKHDLTLWTGFTVTLPGGNLYYAGDTGPGDMRWAAEAAKAGPVRLALLPIGAYHFNGKPSGNHIGPDDAVRAFQQLNAAYALGVHWGTFELTDETMDEPPAHLLRALAVAHIAPDRFRVTEVGQHWDVPPIRADAAAPAR